MIRSRRARSAAANPATAITRCVPETASRCERPLSAEGLVVERVEVGLAEHEGAPQRRGVGVERRLDAAPARALEPGRGAPGSTTIGATIWTSCAPPLAATAGARDRRARVGGALVGKEVDGREVGDDDDAIAPREILGHAVKANAKGRRDRAITAAPGGELDVGAALGPIVARGR